MLKEKLQSKKEKLKKASHIIAGMVILMHALERYESGHETHIVFAIAGIVFLSVAAFHHRLAKKFRFIDTLFFTIEAILSFVIAYEYLHAGKTGLPYVYIFAGLLQLFAIYFFRKNHRIANSKA